MSDTNTESTTRKQELADAKHDLVEAACGFWFSDNERIRTPFPKEMQEQLKKNAGSEFELWIDSFTEKDAAEVDDQELASVFEMLLFGEALKLVEEGNDDQVITINYPFLPRLGDTVNDEKHAESTVVARLLEVREDQHPYMIIHMKETDSGDSWTSEIELPK